MKVIPMVIFEPYDPEPAALLEAITALGIHRAELKDIKPGDAGYDPVTDAIAQMARHIAGSNPYPLSDYRAQLRVLAEMASRKAEEARDLPCPFPEIPGHNVAETWRQGLVQQYSKAAKTFREHLEDLEKTSDVADQGCDL